MKPTLKLALLPSLLAVSLVLSACDDISMLNETGGKEKTASSKAEVISTDVSVDATPAIDNKSAEEKMIDNLARYRWTLVTATNDQKQPLTSLMKIKEQVMLSFNTYQGQNTISYTVGCNMVNAAYQLQGNTLTTEDGMSTKMMCDDLNIAENSLNTLMQGESQLSIADGTPPMLTQVTSDATTLVWKGRLTAQAKYNSKGETIFWAVSANTQPCVDDSTQACLQVKQITYDDQGIKTSEGEWTEFVGSIDGYQHDSAHDEVLRLQRYKLDTPDTMSATETSNKEYAYVLDTVIESTAIN